MLQVFHPEVMKVTFFFSLVNEETLNSFRLQQQWVEIVNMMFTDEQL